MIFINIYEKKIGLNIINYQFYNNTLRVATNYDNLKFIDSNYQWIRWINKSWKTIKPENW